jgi:hypothetical protein
MTVYISGSIRNDPNFRERFRQGEEAVLKMGHKVINPVTLDTLYPMPWATQKDYANRDINLILTECDAIYMLKGWMHSIGARAEHAVAQWAELVRMYE